MARVGEVFAGIGGLSLGLQRAGLDVVWHAETNWHCRRVLEQRFPSADLFGDVRDLRGDQLPPVDWLAGGFPCQDVSDANTVKRLGLAGARSGLWRHFARLVGELRPEYVLVENVDGLRHRGLDAVLGDLAALGYDAEWALLRAADFGAPHLRPRIYLLAYATSVGLGQGARHCGEPAPPRVRWSELGRGHRWPAEPSVARMANGLPDRVDRTRALGNAAVPVIAEAIGREVLEFEIGCRS